MSQPDTGIITVVQRFRADAGGFTSTCICAGFADDDLDLDPSLLACAQLSASTTAPTQPRVVESRLCVDAFDMSLHAATCVDGRDRKRLERLARYLLRPPFALDAITTTDDGRVRLDIGRKGRCVTMTPHQLLAKLAALVPPPKVHLLRYGACSRIVTT